MMSTEKANKIDKVNRKYMEDVRKAISNRGDMVGLSQVTVEGDMAIVHHNGQKFKFDKEMEDTLRGLSFHLNHKGYLYTSLSLNGKRLNAAMHWLVVGKPAGKLTVDHINEDKTDNTSGNLEIVTDAENRRRYNANRKERLAKERAAKYDRVERLLEEWMA